MRAHLVLGAGEVVGARPGGHVQAVLLVVDLDLGEPDAGVEGEQAHVEVMARVERVEQLAAPEAGHARVGLERLVVAVAGAGLGGASPGHGS